MEELLLLKAKTPFEAGTCWIAVRHVSLVLLLRLDQEQQRQQFVQPARETFRVRSDVLLLETCFCFTRCLQGPSLFAAHACSFFCCCCCPFLVPPPTPRPSKREGKKKTSATAILHRTTRRRACNPAGKMCRVFRRLMKSEPGAYVTAAGGGTSRTVSSHFANIPEGASHPAAPPPSAAEATFFRLLFSVSSLSLEQRGQICIFFRYVLIPPPLL